MPTRDLLDHTGLVIVAGLDGTRLGAACRLLGAEAGGDSEEARALLPHVVTAHEFFVSCLELLLAQSALAALVGDRDGVASSGAAAHLLVTASRQERPTSARLLREVGMTLLRDPGTRRLCVHPTPAFDVFDICLRMARDIEESRGLTVEDQARFYTRFLTVQRSSRSSARTVPRHPTRAPGQSARPVPTG